MTLKNESKWFGFIEVRFRQLDRISIPVLLPLNFYIFVLTNSLRLPEESMQWNFAKKWRRYIFKIYQFFQENLGVKLNQKISE